ncbi:hypothetical protein [Allocoleopsis sp.]|uniref:hypothetical protein n=1 Tax=Allocoleopsis sp. TaxID=3088169 RepID=UPI002FD137E5
MSNIVSTAWRSHSVFNVEWRNDLRCRRRYALRPCFPSPNGDASRTQTLRDHRLPEFRIGYG